MAGTKLGGKKAAETNKKRHGEGFYANIGAIGGRRGTTGGFATPTPCNCPRIPYTHKIANCAGAKGGTISRRKKVEV